MTALSPHPEELGEAKRLEGWGRIAESASWFETALARLLTMDHSTQENESMIRKVEPVSEKIMLK